MTPAMSSEMARLHRENSTQAAAQRRLAAVSKRAARPRRALRARASRWVQDFEGMTLLRGLSRSQLKLVSGIADPFSAAAGAEISTGTQLVMLSTGVVEVTRADGSVWIARAGDAFGESSLFGDPPAKVVALTEVRGYALHARAFWGVLESVPAVAVRLAERMSEDLRASQVLARRGTIADNLAPRPTEEVSA